MKSFTQPHYHGGTKKDVPRGIILRCGNMKWHVRLLDLRLPDFSLGEYIKRKLYETRPATLLDLKKHIRVRKEDMSQNILRWAMRYLPTKLESV